MVHSFIITCLFHLHSHLNISLNILYYDPNVYFYARQSRLALKPDGLFLAAILGGETLK